MKKRIMLAFLVVLGSFLILIENSKAYTCHLGFSSPQSSTGNVIYTGSRGVWTLTSDVSSGTSYWFGTKNGYFDVYNSDTSLGTNFSWTTDPYPNDLVGFYTRYIQIYNDDDQLVCTTNTVVTQVISAATPTPIPTLTPTPTPTPGVLTLSFVSGSRVGERPTYRATGLSGSSATLKFEYSGPSTSNCYYVSGLFGFGCSEQFSVSVNNGVATFTGSNAWGTNDVGRWSARITNTSNQIMSATTYFDVVNVTSPTPTPTPTSSPIPTPTSTPIPGALTLSFVSGSRVGERPTYMATGLSGSSATLKFEYSGPSTSNCYYVSGLFGFGCSEQFSVSVNNGVATFTGSNAWGTNDVGRWSARITDITNSSNPRMSATTYFDVVSATSPTPTPAPTSSPIPTPTSSPMPIDQSRLYSLSEIYDGDLIRGQGDIAVWIVKIVGEKRFKRWLFGPQIFSAYGHLGFNKVKNVSKETVNKFDTSNLIRKFGDAKVYELTDFTPGVSATRRWIQTAETFLQRGFDFDAVYIVNDREFNMYTEGAPLPVTKTDKNTSNENLTATMLRFLGRQSSR